MAQCSGYAPFVYNYGLSMINVTQANYSLNKRAMRG